MGYVVIGVVGVRALRLRIQLPVEGWHVIGQSLPICGAAKPLSERVASQVCKQHLAASSKRTPRPSCLEGTLLLSEEFLEVFA